MLFLAMLIGDAVLFALGYLWLLAVAGYLAQSGGALPSWLHADNLVDTAFDVAVKPFLLWDALKMLLAAVSVAGAWQLFKKRA